ncbi:isomerase [Planotetraspora thailandica]|uniref:Isomerase n=1 Tax=Planotetraspora thailandica TaxID=487172 RepID=A0A8J3V6J4_9ACTN|nr:PhzF family phenazine biosynthesis protein [Planotetraspora thailandica]GII56472.1 isomerase [Planotetraspora thailandica]
MRIYTVDSFTDRPFAGNPAGVCLLDSPVPDAWMQALAAEMRHSETAFVLTRDDGPHSLRWFTPEVEVQLCGHATLATAHILYSLGASGRLEFSTLSGILTTDRSDDGLITMDFPASPPVETEAPESLLAALGVRGLWIGRSRFDYVVEVESADVVRSATPDLDLLRGIDARGVVVTARGDGTPADFVSRFFGPRVGVPEDPVTGSAHCMLSPYWSAKLGRDALVGEQLSARGGVVRTTLRGDRVELAGHATTIWSGTLDITPTVA